VAYGLHNLASVLEGRGDLAGAVPLYREALEICQRIYPRDHPLVIYRLHNLARLLVASGDLAGAEPVLLEYYQRLKERQTTNPLWRKELLPVSIERIVRLTRPRATKPRLRVVSKLEAARAEQNKPASPIAVNPNREEALFASAHATDELAYLGNLYAPIWNLKRGQPINNQPQPQLPSHKPQLVHGLRATLKSSNNWT
jgi:ATP/maltotriose-dependent transcriptional regulator MalT